MSALEPKIYIIGVGSDGLAGVTARARGLLQTANLVLGSEHTLALVPELSAAFDLSWAQWPTISGTVGYIEYWHPWFALVVLTGLLLWALPNGSCYAITLRDPGDGWCPLCWEAHCSWASCSTERIGSATAKVGTEFSQPMCA